jgi:hypothetical protein
MYHIEIHPNQSICHKQKKHELVRAFFYFHMEINMSEGVGEQRVTFAYLGLLTAAYMDEDFDVAAAVDWLHMIQLR